MYYTLVKKYPNSFKYISKFLDEREVAMSIFILEDNMIQASYLRQLIMQFLVPYDEKFYFFSKKDELLEYLILNDDYNIYFLDIHLKNETEGGFVAAKEIRKFDENGMIVFLSSYSELALKSYKYLINAFTFIDKNDELESFTIEIQTCISKYLENKYTTAINDTITISTKTNIWNIQLDKIIYFESIGMHKILLVGVDFYKEFYGSLNKVTGLHEKLVRVHHSYLVNIDYICNIDRKNKKLFTIKNYTIPISKNNYKKIISLLG